jgi:hypothetical protein
MVIFSTQKNFKSKIPSSPNYRKIFFWQDENKAYSLLLHSVTFYDLSFSAFSAKRDSILNFPAQPKELKLIKYKFDKSLYKFQNCTNCHNDK